jgi:tagaturonate epimerase
MGDRFALQACAQLQACIAARSRGIAVTPVWNKSCREHAIIGSEPAGQRAAADAAVAALGWKEPYFVDADHINLGNVDGFIEACDFYTIDVADWIGRDPEGGAVETFLRRHPELAGEVRVPGIDQPLSFSRDFVTAVAAEYLAAVLEAGRVYRHVEAKKGSGRFVTEVSMDETNAAQTAQELLIILAAISDEGIPAQTIAPKFTGRFNKGVDYVGDPSAFAEEFAADAAVVAFAAREYGLPQNLKLSVHSGSDKFSLYPHIRRVLEGSGAGVHLKTAGTTWLEEIVGLAEGGPDGLNLGKEIYAAAYERREDLCAPYATVIDIDASRLPDPETVRGWTAAEFAAAVRHVPACREFNRSFRQLLHVGYKIAAEMGDRYLELVERFRLSVAGNVTTNLLERHILRVFPG